MEGHTYGGSFAEDHQTFAIRSVDSKIKCRGSPTSTGRVKCSVIFRV